MLWKDRLKRLYWKIDPSVGEVIFQRSSKPFSDQRPSFSDPRVNKAFHLDNVTWEHEEFIVKVNNALVEPDLGYAIQGYRTIVGSSKKKGRFGLPSPKPIWKSRFNEKPRKLECAILFDGSLGSNYFYFFAAVLHKIYLLEEHLAIGKTPIIVGKGTFTKKYFRELQQLDHFKKLNWMEIDTPILVEDLIVSSPMYYEPRYWLKTKSLALKDVPEVEPGKKIFVSRSNRNISNFDELKPILIKRGFEIINPGDFTVRQQAVIFNSASHVIGIHGAGLANIFFSQASKSSLLDIAPATLLHSHYYWLASVCGIKYDILVGGSNPNVYGDFKVELKDFENKIESFLAS